MKLLRKRGPSKEAGEGPNLEFRVHGPAEAESILKGMSALQDILGTKEYDAVDSAVQAFFASGTSTEAEKVVETLKGRLLSDAALGMLAYHESLSRQKDEHPATELYGAHRRLLTECRSKGIEAAFRDARRRGVDEYYWDS